MADSLPEPKSRKEQYLAKAAGVDTSVPEAPESREEQYLAAIAEGGGGGGTSDFDQLTNRPKYNGTAMTGETDIPVAPTVVQTIGESETDVMSQKAASSLVYYLPNSDYQIAIGGKAVASGTKSIAIGQNAVTFAVRSVIVGDGTYGGYSRYSVAIGTSAKVAGDGAVRVGAGSNNSGALATGSIAIGAESKATLQGEMNVGTIDTAYGYNNSNYRLISGVYDGQSVHDAATVAQGNTLSTTAPTTSTVGVLGQLYTDTANMHTYQCTAISGDTYTWTQRW